MSDGIDGIVTIIASRDNSKVYIQGTPSTFYAFAAQADNGVVVKSDLTADAASIFLDGDSDQSSTSDSTNTITFTDSRTATAEMVLTLAAFSGTLVPAGGLTLAAGKGVLILNDLLSSSNIITTALTIDADFESEGDGTLTIFANKVVDSNDSHITITAWDVSLDGGLASGAGTIQFHGAKVGQTLGLGLVPKDMDIQNSELLRVSSSGGLRVGTDDGGSVAVGSNLVNATQHVLQIASIVAMGDDHQVMFKTIASTFDTIAAQADNGVVVTVDVTTTTGAIYLDCDVENSSSEDGSNTVGFTDGRVVTAKTLLTLEASTGKIEPAGKLTLNAGTGVVFLDDLLGAATGKPLVIDADYENHGDGILTVWAGKTIRSNNADITVTAWDLDLQGDTLDSETVIAY